MTDRSDYLDIPSARNARPVTRRELIRRLGAGAGALSLGSLLTACGIQGQAEGDGATERNTLTTNEMQGELNFANWPAYIDKAQGESPTLRQFERETGIAVNYQEIINDNLSFFGTIRAPLASDQPIEWDLIVVTDWLINKMANLGYLEQLDHTRLPNFEAHAASIYKNPIYDPGNEHSVPWQAGITGIAYNTDLTGTDVTSVMDLFDPTYEGKVGMMREMRDTMNLVLLGLGINPEEANLEDAEQAQQRLIEQQEAGIVRQYYGNDYVAPLANGDLAVTMAWSGDVLGKTLANPAIKFAVPDEGGLLWVDNLAIPEGAAHPIDAHMMMDFVYQPAVAAQMTAWINYISPVPEAQEILSKAEDRYTKQVAESPLVFPTPEMESRLFHYRNLDPEEEQRWNDLFDEVIQR